MGLFRPFFFLISALLVFSSAFAQNQSAVVILENKKKTKKWLADTTGNRISKKYSRIWPIWRSVDTLSNVYFEFSSKKNKRGRSTNGLLRNDGEVIISDTSGGNIYFLNEDHFCFESDQIKVFDLDGNLDSAYTENFYYYNDGVVIKRKNDLFAAFTTDNVQLTDYIYESFDTGDFRHYDPPVLVFMVLPGKEEVHVLGLDGSIIPNP